MTAQLPQLLDALVADTGIIRPDTDVELGRLLIAPCIRFPASPAA